jgi:phosphatidylserine/phosphatidylglycerophosphate/cardiolipin synthase-like enzyme
MTALRTGDGCWRIESARRVAFLIDTEAYYASLREALEKAERSIWILGWAFDPRTRLAPDGCEGRRDPDEIGEILIRLANAKPDLDVRVLVWKSALSINGSHTLLEHRARKLFRSTRVNYREDGLTPFGACHHQKLVIIDGELAFCGGADLAVNRWDTLDHAPADPRRILPHKARHAPRHDVMVLMQGAVATALGDLFRWRWARVCGETLAPPLPAGATWPAGQTVHLSDVEIGIARTLPASSRERPVQEIVRLHLAAIAAARRTIYLENQYFTSHLITEALAARLAEDDGPEVVLVLTRRAPSWFDRMAMDPARAPLIRRLAMADRHGRFRAYAPVTAAGEGIVVHSKVGVFDDELAYVGSANLNNRAEGLDTECEVVLAGTDAATRAELVRFRDLLVSHFLGIPAQSFTVRRQGVTSLIAAIESCNWEGRLQELTPSGEGWWSGFVSRHRLGDAAEPSESWRVFKPRRSGGP